MTQEDHIGDKLGRTPQKMTAPLDPPTHWYRRSSATDRTQAFVQKLPGDPIAHL